MTQLLFCDPDAATLLTIDPAYPILPQPPASPWIAGDGSSDVPDSLALGTYVLVQTTSSPGVNQLVVIDGGSNPLDSDWSTVAYYAQIDPPDVTVVVDPDAATLIVTDLPAPGVDPDAATLIVV